MANTNEQWQQCREEVNRLRRELRAHNAQRATLSTSVEIEAAKQKAHQLQEQYNAALQKLNEMKKQFQWEECVAREFNCAILD